ncbi:lipocalin family protein [Bowmanella sp. JS7-9]|uniref:Outer membrane lipoprotein Blc n=1 Tax=Pseudobowmanella zhangzhouensis TaxID=1537679 RepID=A0ABW1XQE7_9ALTE|nr:lipocalin family protein [Bowmanella sp. JS7-9]TBX23678.1 lipocalin [Bowmanella sp. JS7-9]
MRQLCIAIGLILLSACTGVPEGIKPVSPFNLERYLGTWYEIARMPHSFEDGLNQVTANYSLREDGGVKVINRGYDTDAGKWQQAEGKAYFVEDNQIGHLKVSFFGPFYGAYVVFELDHLNYQYAFVSGPDREYLWFLARTPTVSPELLAHFQQTAAELGFDTSKLIYSEQQ